MRGCSLQSEVAWRCSDSPASPRELRWDGGARMETDLLHLLELEDALAALGLGPRWFRRLGRLNGVLVHAVAAHDGG
jgi:hypothetical protein